jgi:hypothetical protein
LLVCDYKGKEAARLVTRIDPGVVWLVADLRGHERKARRGTGPVEDRQRGAQAPRRIAGGDQTGHDQRPAHATGQAAVPTLHEAGLLPSRGRRRRRDQRRNARVAALQKRWDRLRSGVDLILRQLNAVVCSRVHELQEALSAGTIALEISSRNSRVAALQNRWDRLRAGLDLVLDQRGANMADPPGGASGKGKEADKRVTSIDPGVVALVAELRGHGANSVFSQNMAKLSVAKALGTLAMDLERS